MSNVRSNSQSNFKINVARPQTTSINLGVPNVARFKEGIANVKTRSELNLIRLGAEERNDRLRDSMRHLNNAGRYANKLSDVASETFHKRQQMRFEAELRNEQLIATNIANEFADELEKESLNPNGFMHTPYSPSNNGDKGTSSEQSLSNFYDDFQGTSELFKNASPRVKEFAKQKMALYYEKALQKARVRDAETRFSYEIQTHNNDRDAWISSFNSSVDALSLNKLLNGETKLPDEDEGKVKNFIAYECWLSTIGSTTNSEYTNWSGVFDFENWDPNNPKIINEEEYQKLRKEFVSHIAMGATIHNLNAMVKSNDDEAVDLMLKEAYGVLENKNLTDEDKEILYKNIDAISKHRGVFLKERAINIVNAQTNSLANVLRVADDPNTNIDSAINSLTNMANKVSTSYSTIAKGDEKLADKFLSDQLTSIASACVGTIMRERDNIVKPLYDDLNMAATLQMQIIGNKVVDERYMLGEAKEQNRAELQGAYEAYNNRIEELRNNPQLKDYVDAAIANVEKNKNFPELRKHYMKSLQEQIKAGGKTNAYGEFEHINLPKMAIQIEQLYNSGIITIEDRIELFETAQKAQKFKPEYKTEIIQDISSFTGIESKELEKIINEIPEDLNPYSNFEDILDLIDDDDTEKANKIHNNKGKSVKLSHDALFSLYAIGYEYYTSGQMFLGSQKTHSFLDILNQLNDKDNLSEWNELENQKRVEYSRQIIRDMRNQPGNLWMNQSLDYNWTRIRNFEK